MPKQYYYNFTGQELFDFTDKQKAVYIYCATMFNRTRQIFSYTGLPETIPEYMLERIMQIEGFACFAKVNDELYVFSGGLGGEPDVYYRPTTCAVSSPALKFSKQLEIGKDCAIVINDTMMQGLVPIFTRYATAMAENDITFDIACKYTRALFLLSAPDDNTKESALQFLEDIANGKAGVISENAFLDGIKVNPLTDHTSRIFSELINYHQYLRASWYNEIGLNANYNMKRESLSNAETAMNFDALLPLIDDMMECRKKGLEKVNALFGTNITVTLSSAWADIQKRFEENDTKETDIEQNPNESGVTNDAEPEKAE
jgi:hypothetical protein